MCDRCWYLKAPVNQYIDQFQSPSLAGGLTVRSYLSPSWDPLFSMWHAPLPRVVSLFLASVRGFSNWNLRFMTGGRHGDKRSAVLLDWPPRGTEGAEAGETRKADGFEAVSALLASSLFFFPIRTLLLFISINIFGNLQMEPVFFLPLWALRPQYWLYLAAWCLLTSYMCQWFPSEGWRLPRGGSRNHRDTIDLLSRQRKALLKPAPGQLLPVVRAKRQLSVFLQRES